jgi:hypothetical protein
MIDSKYKPLETDFKSRGFQYHQEYRADDDWAIYSQKKDNQILSYEVFQIQKNEAYEIHGNQVEAKEGWPSDGVFGRTAWSVHSLERAHEKIKEIKNKKMQNEERKEEIQAEKLAETAPVQAPAQTQEIKTNNPKRGGRKPILKQCKRCPTMIYSSVFQKNRGLCPECLKKL